MSNIPQIKLLSQELSNQIAAGEVVERPASVLKELVENALDAKATEVTVIMEDGGQSLIRVQDNGCGIHSKELELAVTRHATSKIESIASLSQISSYGFRGEALPSIASVSKFRIISKVASEEQGHELNVEFGKMLDVVPHALREGTLIEVRDLFFNIPARLKFLKNPSTELKRATELFTGLGLIAKGVNLSLYAGTRLCLRFSAEEDLKDRLTHIWPPAITDALLAVDHHAHGIRVTGYISHPRSHQPRADRMLFYVNNRVVSDKLIMRAVRQALQGKMTTRDYPQCVLCINLPAHEVDVNVHPAKNEVRFRDEKALFSAVMYAVQKTIDGGANFSARQLLSGQTDAPKDVRTSPQEAQFGDLYTPKPLGFWGDADRETGLSFYKNKQNQEPVGIATEIKSHVQDDDSSPISNYPRNAQALGEPRAAIAPFTETASPIRNMPFPKGMEPQDIASQNITQDNILQNNMPQEGISQALSASEEDLCAKKLAYKNMAEKGGHNISSLEQRICSRQAASQTTPTEHADPSKVSAHAHHADPIESIQKDGVCELAQESETPLDLSSAHAYFQAKAKGTALAQSHDREQPNQADQAQAGQDQAGQAETSASTNVSSPIEHALPGDLVYLGQIAETYLLLKKGNDALLLLDQHAAHERILYEQVRRGQINSQNLLVPIEIVLHKSERNLLSDLMPKLQELGFHARLRLQNLVVSAVPTLLTRTSAIAFLKDILAEKSEDLEPRLIVQACKSALKANTELDTASALSLINKWLTTDEPDYCPHGRPCVLYFDASKLEQMFKRKTS